MKTKYLTILPAMAMMAPLPSSAGVKLEDTLDKVAKKVDTDGSYLQVNKIDKDIALLERYGSLVLKALSKDIDEIPENIDVKKLSELIGLQEMKAMAISSKKVDGAWNNRSYTWTGGSQKGMLSFYGKANEKLSVAEFAPETADLAVQIRLDLRKMTTIIMEVAKQLEKGDEVKEFMTKPMPEIGGMTAAQMLSKLNVRLSYVIDIDRANRFNPAPTVDLPVNDMIVRLDGAVWIWGLFEDKIIKEGQIPWQKKVVGNVTTYTLPEEMKQAMKGYSPTIVVDTDKNLIWMGAKEEGVAAAMGDGPKLKDGVAYKKTMATLPKGGNMMMYVSKDMMLETVSLFNKAIEMQAGGGGGEEVKMVKPLIDKFVKDMTASPSGIAAVVQVDETGVNTVLRAPFPTKNYLEKASTMMQVVPLLQSHHRIKNDRPRVRARIR